MFKITNATLCELDLNERSYILNTIWRITHIYNDVAQLIAHPYQRTNQSNTNYNIKEPDVLFVLENQNVESSEVTQKEAYKATTNIVKLENETQDSY